MTNAATVKLRGKNILVVEDDYMVATDVSDFLRDQGASVIGPAGSLGAAMALVKSTSLIDAAVLDVNLRGERVYPVADALIARGVPIVFATGYEELLLERGYVGLPLCPKPIDKTALLRLLRTLIPHAG